MFRRFLDTDFYCIPFHYFKHSIKLDYTAKTFKLNSSLFAKLKDLFVENIWEKRHALRRLFFRREKCTLNYISGLFYSLSKWTVLFFLLSRWFFWRHTQKKNLRVFLTKPGVCSQIGSTIDKYLKGTSELDDHVIHLLFSANRWEMLSELRKNLESGTHVVVDRYAFSGVAFRYPVTTAICYKSNHSTLTLWQWLNQ